MLNLLIVVRYIDVKGGVLSVHQNQRCVRGGGWERTERRREGRARRRGDGCFDCWVLIRSVDRGFGGLL